MALGRQPEGVSAPPWASTIDGRDRSCWSYPTSHQEAAIAISERQCLHPNGAQDGTKRVVSAPPDKAGGREAISEETAEIPIGAPTIGTAGARSADAAPARVLEQARAGPYEAVGTRTNKREALPSGGRSSFLHPPVPLPAEAMPVQVPGSRPERKREGWNEGTFGDSYQEVVACPKPGRRGSVGVAIL